VSEEPCQSVLAVTSIVTDSGLTYASTVALSSRSKLSFSEIERRATRTSGFEHPVHFDGFEGAIVSARSCRAVDSLTQISMNNARRLSKEIPPGSPLKIAIALKYL